MENYKQGIVKLVSCILLLGVSFTHHACMDKFLEERYNYSQVIPQTLEDYQAIMDNSGITNDYSAHALGILSGDECYIRDGIYNSARSIIEKNTYIWERDLFGMEEVNEWNYAYKRILHCNIVLDGLLKSRFDNSDKVLRRAILGTAYFTRAFAYFQLGQVFCVQYDVSTAEIDLGLPLRTDYDINTVVKRSSVADLYRQIIADLKEAIELLPKSTLVRERPNKAAAFALLARVYLQTSNYEEAYLYAKLGLEESNKLLDFKTLYGLGNVKSNGSYFTFEGTKQTNPEILFMSRSANIGMLGNFVGGDLTVDTVLLSSYSSTDLRKKAYFYKSGNTDVFIGTYTGEPIWFTGIATDELYLILAESACRIGYLEESLVSLNRLLSHRFDSTFVPLEINDKGMLLSRVLEERRKELFFRGTRWSDLRRLNKEEEFSKILYRHINGQIYELQPNSNRYIMPIPYASVHQSGLVNNNRD